MAHGIFSAPDGSPTFQFSTHYHDLETGLVYAKHRYYQPATGAWLSRDLLEEEGGVNLYGYVGNSPTNGFDPLGLRPHSQPGGLATGAQKLAVAADCAIPFFDPFSDKYDKCDPDIQNWKLAGEIAGFFFNPFTPAARLLGTAVKFLNQVTRLTNGAAKFLGNAGLRALTAGARVLANPARALANLAARGDISDLSIGTELVFEPMEVLGQAISISDERLHHDNCNLKLHKNSNCLDKNDEAFPLIMRHGHGPL